MGRGSGQARDADRYSRACDYRLRRPIGRRIFGAPNGSVWNPAGCGRLQQVPHTRGAECLEAGYFFTHLFEATCHIPPAFSQSALVMYWERSLELPEGLAEGVVDEPPDAPGVVAVPPPDEAPVLPAVPEVLLEPELPGLLPLLVCAAAIAGARAMLPTRSAITSFCISISSDVGVAGRFRSCRSVRAAAISGPTTATL